MMIRREAKESFTWVHNTFIRDKRLSLAERGMLMRHHFQATMPEVADKIKFYIGDVRSLESVRGAMQGVDYIFHAAALKQVPSCEFFPMEAVRTNVIGTDNVLTAAIEAGVKCVICLSTDKAAYPINAMGISKSLEEKVWFPVLLCAGFFYISGFDISSGYYLCWSLCLTSGLVGLSFRFPKLTVDIDISYGMFLYHMTVVNVFVCLGIMGNWVYVIPVTVITMILAYLSKISVGRFSYNKKQQLIDNPTIS